MGLVIITLQMYDSTKGEPLICIVDITSLFKPEPVQGPVLTQRLYNQRTVKTVLKVLKQ